MTNQIIDFSMEFFSLKGKVAIVTGGNTGLGQGFAVALAKAGADIFISARSQNFEETKNLLQIFEGNFPVYMYFEDTKQRMLAPKSLWCTQSDLLVSELERVLGAGNVKVK